MPSPTATRRSSITGAWRTSTGWTSASTIAWSGLGARTAPSPCTRWTASAAPARSGPQAGHRHRLLRPAQLPAHSRREPEQGPSLLLRSRTPTSAWTWWSIGGKNSAAIAALELWRGGARVTLVHRGPEIQPHVKYWIKPDIENRIKNGEIKAYFQLPGGRDHARTRSRSRRPRAANAQERFRLRHDRLPPRLRVPGGWACVFEGPTVCPSATPETLESNVPGIYLAGVIVAGSRTNEIFIENGRFQARARQRVRRRSR
jgi:hypothetical protein